MSQWDFSYIFQVQADDIDIGPNSMLIYSLSPNNPSFEINPNTGEISLIGQLDRENVDEIMLTVVVTDSKLWSCYKRKFFLSRCRDVFFNINVISKKNAINKQQNHNILAPMYK